ncbi:MAG: hypothetical protein QOE60_2919 [Thermoleophilaceae bacterium]|jgi:hypothetical protein|nr:hypothetical protein [Thermoleophilaceae bacterium]
MSSRREQKEALRRERERREAEAKAASQRKRLVGIAGAVAIGVAAIVIVLVASGGGGGSDPKSAGNNFPDGGSLPKQKVFDLAQAAAAAGCELKSNRATSREHLEDPNQKVKYPQNPPTSGKHFAVPAEDGLYNGPPPLDTALVHALEHGRVIVWAKPSLPVSARKQLRALFEEDSYQMIFVRRPNMPYAVAATAWNHDPTPDGTGRLMGCPKWDEKVIDALRAFRDEHRSNGPEDIP